MVVAVDVAGHDGDSVLADFQRYVLALVGAVGADAFDHGGGPAVDGDAQALVTAERVADATGDGSGLGVKFGVVAGEIDVDKGRLVADLH